MTSLIYNFPQRLHSQRKIIALVRLEFVLLFRQKLVAYTNICSPIFILSFPLWYKPQGISTWATLLVPMFVVTAIFSVMMTAGMMITSRRENLIYKTLRTSEITQKDIIISSCMFLYILGIIQEVIIYIGYRLLGGPAPDQPWYLFCAIFFLLLLCIIIGAVVGLYTREAANIMYTTTPAFLFGATSANLFVQPLGPAVHHIFLFLPFGGICDCILRAFTPLAPLYQSYALSWNTFLIDIFMSSGYCLILGYYCMKKWKWDKRN